MQVYHVCVESSSSFTVLLQSLVQFVVFSILFLSAMIILLAAKGLLFLTVFHAFSFPNLACLPVCLLAFFSAFLPFFAFASTFPY